jgi:pyrimidine deaminase RibD-like protein
MNDKKFMELAIEQSKKCIQSKGAFNVGAVLVDRNGMILATGYSREIPGNTHAEECCFLKLLGNMDAIGGTIYSSMEPCGQRLSGKICCAELIINAQLKRVVQGVREPPTFVGTSVGTQILQNAGIEVDFLVGYEKECLDTNRHLNLT